MKSPVPIGAGEACVVGVGLMGAGGWPMVGEAMASAHSEYCSSGLN